jgi:sporulation protein YlmC with PRC-barrel domain
LPRIAANSLQRVLRVSAIETPQAQRRKEKKMTDALAIDETARLIASDKVEGTKVYNKQGEKLGSVMNFMVDKRSGDVQYAVMEFGGLLGIGSEYYPLPWNMLDYDENQGGYVVDLDKSSIEGAPSYKDKSPVWDHAYGQSVFGYYGLAYPYL